MVWELGYELHAVSIFSLTETRVIMGVGHGHFMPKHWTFKRGILNAIAQSVIAILILYPMPIT